MALELTLNGETRVVGTADDGSSVAAVLDGLGLKADRVALELNGVLVPRSQWGVQTVRSGDRMEVVHFVGGGRSQGE